MRVIWRETERKIPFWSHKKCYDMEMGRYSIFIILIFPHFNTKRGFILVNCTEESLREFRQGKNCFLTNLLLTSGWKVKWWRLTKDLPVPQTCSPGTEVLRMALGSELGHHWLLFPLLKTSHSLGPKSITTSCSIPDQTKGDSAQQPVTKWPGCDPFRLAIAFQQDSYFLILETSFLQVTYSGFGSEMSLRGVSQIWVWMNSLKNGLFETIFSILRWLSLLHPSIQVCVLPVVGPLSASQPAVAQQRGLLPDAVLH